ncbi:MAG: L,D-transpeptidase [Bacteroidales bacterium]|nr:L,D-transpeptidase [Bacteroidales bacterium]
MHEIEELNSSSHGSFILRILFRIRNVFSAIKNYLLKVYLKVKSYKRFWRISRICGVYFTFIFVFILLWSVALPWMQELTLKGEDQRTICPEPIDNSSMLKYETNLERRIKTLTAKMNIYKPAMPYIIINSEMNCFYLYKRGKLVREGICSTGSNILLESDDDQKWIFKTPKGLHRVLAKKTAPVWRKPDWAFVEEGVDIPSQNHPSRYEFGVLGDYALSMGDGYMIHGTLFQRFLGLPVTHGCIRLGDEDLKVVYYTLQTGSKVYIY